MQVYSRPLRCRRRSALDELGRLRVTVVGEEKGIDVRISLDVIQMAGAYPAPSGATAERGVDMTDWIPIDRATYEACLVRPCER